MASLLELEISQKLIVISASFSKSPGVRDTAELSKSLSRIDTYLSELSRNHLDLEFEVLELGQLGIAADDAKSWAETSTFLDKAWTQLGGINDVSHNEVIALAQEMLSGDEGNFYREVNGYNIETLNLEFVQSGNISNIYKEMSLGEIALHFIDLPYNLNLDPHSFLLFDIYDEIYDSGGYQKILHEEDGVTQSGLPIADIKALVSGSTVFNINQPLRLQEFDPYNPPLEPELHKTWYTQNQVVLTEWDRKSAHEIVHGIGIGTHDNGLDYFTDRSVFHNIENRLINDDLYGTYAYGDWFSLMGTSSYALGLAP